MLSLDIHFFLWSMHDMYSNVYTYEHFRNKLHTLFIVYKCILKPFFIDNSHSFDNFINSDKQHCRCFSIVFNVK